MRIIAGKHKSRILKTLEGLDTRPMTDRMKESVFNTIGPYFSDIRVLDLFGGSGALSLEAISRGAKEAFIVDMNKKAVNLINENVKLLNEEDSVQILNTSYQEALRALSFEKFDLIFLDPPYKMNVINEIIEILIKNEMLNKKAIIVCQYVKGNVTIPKDFNVIKNYVSGSSELVILQS